MFNRGDIKDIYPLTPMQEGILFHSIMDREVTAYFEQTSLELEGELDFPLYKESLNKLIERYDVLRTVFMYEKVKSPVQMVLKQRKAEVHYEDITAMKHEDKENYIEKFKAADRKKGFDLKKDLLIRVSVIRVEKDIYEIIWSFHHIIMDGWCMGIIINDSLKIYNSLKSRLALTLPQTYSYNQYILWLQKQDKEKAIEYWEKYLEGYEMKASIPIIAPKNEIQTYAQDTLEISFDEEQTEKIIKLAKENQVTINSIFQTVWGIILQSYTGSEDVVFGTVVSGRPAEVNGIESMVGLFINTIPLRVKVHEEDTFNQLIMRVQTSSIESRAYEYSALADIQTASVLKHDLFDHIMVFENYPLGDEILGELRHEKLGFSLINASTSGQTNYNLNIVVIPVGNRIRVKLNYNMNIYEKCILENVLECIKSVISQVVQKPEINIKDIEIVGKEEKKKILFDFNNTCLDFLGPKTIHELFEAQVNKAPDDVVIVYQGDRLTYRELNVRANQLARVLVSKDIKPDDIVGIMVERSVEMIIGILGVLKAGGAYLPLDPEHPKERIEYILSDSGAKMLLTQKNINLDFHYSGELLELDDQSLYEGDSCNLDIPVNKDNLVYVIYTSGTTGNPKGVLIQHESLTNYIKWFIDEAEITHKDKAILLSSFAFDLGYTTLYSSILQGAELHIIPKETYIYSEQLVGYINNNNISYMKLTPSLYRSICNTKNFFENINLSSLRLVILGGEDINVFDIKNTYEQCSNVKIMNHYGPTETTIGTVANIVEPDKLELFTRTSLIGRPIKNSKCLILDKHSRLAPVGAAGELCIVGVGLARGYLNRPELTEEKFVPNPYEHEMRMYKTGDLARWLPDGTIEFLGRIDHQVKIRGYRIELGEIENKLINHPNIKEAVVIAKQEESGEKNLCAYIVSQKEMTVVEIREYLSKDLPEYMLPSYYVRLNAFPLTANGKIDTKALPKSDGSIVTGIEYQAPRNLEEEKLASIWKDILKLHRIGINDNFFEIGGHSLKATILCGRIQKEFDIEIGVRDIFENPSIAELSEMMLKVKGKQYESLKPIEKRKWYNVSSGQKRLYALQAMNTESIAYNMPIALELRGEVDKSKIEETVKSLVNVHEVLRTSFHMEGEAIVQKVHDEVEVDFKYKKVEGKQETDKILEEWLRPFKLNEAPLLRVELIEEINRHIILIDIHHIICDGTTMGILIDDFIKAFNETELKVEEVQYKEYAHWEQAQKEKGSWEKQKEYWKNIFAGEIPVLEIPLDGVRGKAGENDGSRIIFEIDKETVNLLKKTINSIGGTFFMGIVAGYSILLSKYSGQEDIVIGSPIAGRRLTQMERVAGMFLNTLAIRTRPEKNKRVIDFLKETKQNLLDAYDNQDYPFEELVDELNVRRDFTRNPLFDVMLILQNMEIKPIELPEIQVTPCEISNKRARFDMTINLQEQDGKVVCDVEYRSKLYNKETIERMMKHYVNVLKEIGNNAEKTIREINILDEKEQEQLLMGFNDMKVIHKNNYTIQKLFEEQVAKTPDKVAVVCQNKTITYKELNNRANQLAALLRKKGVKPDNLVGIMVERSIEMIVGIIGILKSGGAYIPIDYNYPKDRIEHILSESEALILLTQENLVNDLLVSAEKIYINNENLFAGSINNLKEVSDPTNLAYVIYTSGSTGSPKGVMIENRSVVNFIKGISDRINFNQQKAILSLTTISFDIFGMESLLPLTKGMKIVIATEDETVDSVKISELIEKEKVSMLQATPSRMKFIMNDERSLKGIAGLEEIMVGGEELPVSLLKQLQETSTAKIYNMYGPSETTIWSTIKEVTVDDKVTIGTPIFNTGIYIIDKNNNLCPIGVPGELCISGEGLSRGYLGKPDLTAEKFIDNPFQPGEKIYKTGDQVKQLSNGNLQFMGRMDNQVKIRGYRIELEEIENVIKQQNGVKEVVVTVKKAKSAENNIICAYLVIDSIHIETIKSNVKKMLPNYMIPSSYIIVDNIPLTTNGKIDKQTLLKVNGSEEKRLRILPKDYHSNVIAEIWKEVLNINEVYIDDDFFEMGGNSINIIRVTNQIKEKLEIEVAPADLMVYKSIRELSEFISSKNYSNRENLKNVFKINKSKSKKNIFIIHGGDADIFYYRYLAKLLENEYSVYGLQPTGMHNEQPLRCTYHEMTYDYAREIRMIQKEGPYIIAGYCVGGYIAYDLAVAFEAQGDKVDALIQLDQEAFVFEGFFYTYRQYLNNIRLKSIEMWRKRAQKDKMYTLEKLINMVPKSKPISMEQQKDVFKDRDSIREYMQNRLLYNGYSPLAPYIKIPTLVIKTEENNHRLLTKDLWKKMARGPLEYIEIPGGHETVLIPPYVERMAEIIKAYLLKIIENS